jgi:hypothetical protein
MPFIAECLFCHAKVRVPDDSAGKSVSCPRCGDWFTLAPMKNQPEVSAVTARPSTAAAAAAVLAAAEAEEESQPQPAVDPSSTATPPPRTRALPDPEPWRRPWMFPYELFGGVSLVLAAAGVACAPLRGCEGYAIGFGVLALGMGLCGFVVAGKPDRGGRVKPAVGACLGAAVLVVTLFWPGLIGGGPPFGENTPRPLGPNAPIPGAEDVAGDKEAAGTRGASYILGTVQVRVAAAESVPVKAVGRPSTLTPERLLQITLRVYNGSGDRPLTYYSWLEPMPGEKSCTTVLRDDRGKSYNLISHVSARPAPGRERGVKLQPGGRTDEVLTFEAPSGAGSKFVLELPLAAVGGTGTLRLEIPGSTITVR